jgi:hypothetical protein
MKNYKVVLMLYLIAFCLLIPALSFSAVGLSVSVTRPIGSASQAYNSSFSRNIIFSPCVNESTVFGNVAGVAGVTVNSFFDQFQVKITATNQDVNSDGSFEYDLYFFLVNVSASGTVADIANNQFYVFRRYDAFTVDTAAILNGVEVVLKENAAALDNNDIYLRAQDFSTAVINETIFGGNISFDSFNLLQGT